MIDIATFSRRSFLVMPLALAACKTSGAAVLELTGLTMGTTYKVVAIDPTRRLRQGDLRAAVEAPLLAVNAQMSNWDAGSEVSRFNTAGAGTMPVSDGFARVMQAASEVHAGSGGAFDVTVGPLIDLWGFGAAGSAGRVPSDAEITAALGRVSQDRIGVGAGALTKQAPEVAVYLSAIGKGHGVDAVAEALRGLGLTDFMVEIGGDLYTAGLNAEGQPWRIGIETPLPGDRSLQDVVAVSDLGMASSGDYRNFFEADGQRYSHIIDPATGRPITHGTVATTVLAGDAMRADAWATAMLTLGTDRGRALADEMGLAVLFVDRTETGFVPTASAAFAALGAA